jgi:glycine cleavage system H protein
MSNVPAELRYTSSHEWIKVEGDLLVIGITDFAQSELGDVVYVELPEPGRALGQGESFGNVESVKTVSEIYAPVAGEVVEVNGALAAQSELVNSDPYGSGYLLKMRPTEPSSVDLLLDAGAYSALVS